MKTLLASLAAALLLIACGDATDMEERAQDSLDAHDDERLDLWMQHCACYDHWSATTACMALDMNYGCALDSVTTEWLRGRAKCGCGDDACLGAALGSSAESVELIAFRDACRGACDDSLLSCDSPAWRGLTGPVYSAMSTCLATATTCEEAQICATPCLR